MTDKIEETHVADAHEGEVVLDNCLMSGTTGVACANTGRRFIGIELEPKYFDIACERISRACQLRGSVAGGGQ